MEKSILERHCDDNLSQRQIAEKLACSQATVKYWLGKYGLKTKHNRHAKLAANPSRYVDRECKHHGETKFIFEKSKNGYRCVKCRSGRVNEQRRNLKRKLIEAAGGRCIHCGYNESIWSLHFHHRNKLTKQRNIGHLIRDRKLQLALEEIKLCDLVCANCHGEIEELEWSNQMGL